MKPCLAWIVGCAFAMGICLLAPAGSTIDAAHAYAYGADVGWLNARLDGTNGAVIGQTYCTGYVWSANCGWISLGRGPTNGWRYSNTAGDWGVNHDGAGRLSGYAYGANIGWLVFEPLQGQPRIDLGTGNLSGYVWGANVGWIGLSNAQAYVRTVSLDPGPDSDLDLLPDAYEYAHTNALQALSGVKEHDADGDGVTDLYEAAADTDPLDSTDFLKIVSIAADSASNLLVWTARPTRLYRLEGTNAITGGGAWADAGPGLLGPSSTVLMTQCVASAGTTTRFYRVEAVRPLSE